MTTYWWIQHHPVATTRIAIFIVAFFVGYIGAAIIRRKR